LLDHGHLIVEVIVFTLLMVPVERWIGTTAGSPCSRPVMSAREKLQLDLDPSNPQGAHLPRPARRVNLDGLLGAAAIALGTAGMIVLARGRRSAHRTDQAHIEL
jgi:hypothetical protein